MEDFDFEKVVQILSAINLIWQLIETVISVCKISKKEKKLRKKKYKQRHGK